MVLSSGCVLALSPLPVPVCFRLSVEVALQFLLCSSESLNNLLRLGIAHGQVSKEQRQAFLTWKAPLPLHHFLHPGWALGLSFFFKYYSHFLAREAACRS